MEKDYEKQKKRYMAKSKPITSLIIGLTFFSVILLVTMFSTSKDNRVKNRIGGTDEDTEGQNLTYDSEMLAVITGIDNEKQQITMLNMETREKVLLYYTGGCDIRDKFDQVVAASQLEMGAIVEVGYRKEEEKLVRMKTSTKAWEHRNVSNLSVDSGIGSMTIGSVKYRYTEDIVIVDDDIAVPVDNLAEQDMLTVRGMAETIWSITITKGHGRVKLEDYEEYLGANITVGYEPMQQITKGMTITVREGEQSLTVDNGKYSASKYISVTRNKDTIVSLSNLGPDRKKITFEVEPYGADLLIDNELTAYSEPIPLMQGEYEITVSLGGYTTYEGKLVVGEADKTVKITLPEEDSTKEVSISEAEDKTGTEGTGAEDNEVQTDTGEAGMGNIDEAHHIYIQNPVGASIYFDGKFMGISPAGISKAIGKHVMTLIKEDYKTKSFQIEILDDGLDTYFSMPDLEKSN